MMISNNIYELYVFQFLMGSTFAGRTVVGLNYVLEFQSFRYQENILFTLLFVISFFVLFMTLWYQFIDNGWFLLQLIVLITTVLGLLYFVIAVPESSKW